MKQRYSILQRDCHVDILKFYVNAAKIIGVVDSDDISYDCRKIQVTKVVQNEIMKYYAEDGNSSEDISGILLMFGPKANLSGDGFEFVVEDGFIASEVN